MHSLISGRLQREKLLKAQFNTWGFIWGFIPTGNKETDLFCATGLKKSTKGTLVTPGEQTGHCKQVLVKNTDVLCLSRAVSALHCKSCTECGDHAAGSRASSWNLEKWVKHGRWNKETGVLLIKLSAIKQLCYSNAQQRNGGTSHLTRSFCFKSLLQTLPSITPQQQSNLGYREQGKPFALTG